MQIIVRIRPRTALWVLTVLALLLSVLGVADNMIERSGGRVARALEPLLKLDAELSLARWYSSVLLLLGALLAAIALQRSRAAAGGFRGSHSVAWASIALVLLLLSANKVTLFRSTVFWLVRGAYRALGVHVDIPRAPTAAVIFVLLVAAYLPLLLSLGRRDALRFLLAGGVYLAGVVVLDVLPWILWRRLGEGSPILALSSTVEELTEMVGAILILRALLHSLAAFARNGKRRVSTVQEAAPP